MSGRHYHGKIVPCLLILNCCSLVPVQQPQLKSFAHPHGLWLSVLLLRARNGMGNRINVIAFRSSIDVALYVIFVDDSRSLLMAICLLYRASVCRMK